MQGRDGVGLAPGAWEGSWAGAAACQGGPCMAVLGRTPAAHLHYTVHLWKGSGLNGT